MKIESITGTRQTFYYKMLPSTSQLAEIPTYFSWRILKSSEKFWNQETTNLSQLWINRTLAILSGAGGYLGGAIALPMTLACTPVTIVADIIVGIAECSFCYYHGLSGDDIKKIAHRKIIASPLQQLVFCSTAASASAIAGILLSGGFILRLSISNPYLLPFVFAPFWTMGYSLGQVAVGKLPSHLNHQSFNIFINGGSGEDGEKKWLDEDFTLPEEPSHEESKTNLDWINYIEKEMCHLSAVDDANINAKYSEFKRKVFERKTPQELLGLEDNFSKTNLNTSYKALAKILHPDKNASSTEANSLFKILGEAYTRLSKK